MRNVDEINRAEILAKQIANLYQDETYEARKVGRTQNGNYIIDTVFAFDTEKYETAVKIIGGKWIIVEEYDVKATAHKGHEKWVKSMDKNPRKLFDVHSLRWILL